MKTGNGDNGKGFVLIGKGALVGPAGSAVAQQLQEAIASGKVDVSIDLHAVSMMDSAMLECLLKGRDDCRAGGGSFTLLHPSEPATKILKLTRLDREFAMEGRGSEVEGRRSKEVEE